MNDESSTAADLELWDRLLSKQTVIYRNTAIQNQNLTKRVEELERELSVWKVAFKAAEQDKIEMSSQVNRLERNIGSLKDDNPLILCLIDGDGNIFSAELIAAGRMGGRRAAMLLTQGLTQYLEGVDPQDGPTGRGQIWLTVYCNQKGLMETLTSNRICTNGQFEDFIMGFNQANPLFTFIDVGAGKEAADSKIKECLRVFTRFPQISRVFFGGAHDNGYSSALNYLHNEGLGHKIVILRGYRDFAHELKSLNIPYADIPNLFLTQKIRMNHIKNATPANNNSNILPQELETSMNRFPSPNATQTQSSSSDAAQTPPTPSAPASSTSPYPGTRMLIPGLPLYKQQPPPCNFHYLASCLNEKNCRYAHDYALSQANIDDLRQNAKKWPCPLANRGHHCMYGRNCPMAHLCPKGPKCSFAKNGKCKFVAKGMHGASDSPQANVSSISSPPQVATPSSAYSALPLNPFATQRKLKLDIFEQLRHVDAPSPSRASMRTPLVPGGGLADDSEGEALWRA